MDKTLTQEVVLFEGETTKGKQTLTHDPDDNWVIVNHDGNEISLSVENWNLLTGLAQKVIAPEAKEKLYAVADKDIFEVQAIDGGFVQVIDKQGWGNSIPLTRVERFCNANGLHIKFNI